jgi:hypothetical protein
MDLVMVFFGGADDQSNITDGPGRTLAFVPDFGTGMVTGSNGTDADRRSKNQRVLVDTSARAASQALS